MLFLSLLIIFFEPDKISGVRSPERPVVPNVTALSSTEVRITWCRVNSNKVEIDHYELYIDTQLEYSGVDVMYIAKRLKPWSWYEVKLRACGFSPGSCSPFSRPALVKTMQDGDNTPTVIQSGVNIFKVIVVPTYMFILGMIAGILAISFVFTWRYLQCIDLSEGSTFELPQYVATASKVEYANMGSMKEQPLAFGKNIFLNPENMLHLTKGPQVDDTDSKYCEITPSKCKNPSQQKSLMLAEFLSNCDKNQGVLYEDQVTLQMPTGQLGTTCATRSQVENEIDGIPSLDDCNSGEHELEMQGVIGMNLVQLCDRSEGSKNSYPTNNLRLLKDDTLSLKDDEKIYNKEETESDMDNNVIHICERNERLSNLPQRSDYRTTMCPSLCDLSMETLYVPSDGINISSGSSLAYTQSSDLQSRLSDREVFSEDRMIVAIDNSNIYIGAQECASMANASDRKRHVRVKLQNLVKILEKERPKARGFASGSSPPATEHVWDVYRRLGYIVDLEDRRGKDEQRVDEGLHLWIYKALCELPPGVLVLATGDGMKGKSECDTSFPRCAMTALERGWTVEVYSWKHSLSSEWIKLSKKYPDRLKINYLDKYVNYITFVDGKNGRKCSPFPSEASILQR